VAEVTSLGQGLLEVFSEPCEACHGRGFNVHSEPVAAKPGTLDDDEPAPSGRRRKSGDDDGAVSRAKSRSRTRPIEVEPRAIDPEASLAMEKVHAAAAKAAADKAAGAFPAVVADQWASDDVASDQPVSDEPGAEGDRSSDQTADQSEAPTGRGSRRRGSKKPSRPPIVVRSEPAPVIVPVINLAPASLVELDSTPSPRRRGPRKATRNAGPAAITAAQGDPAV
jgi:ribonuclease E